MFSSFMEKRNLQNKIYDEMIEDAKREEEEKRRKQESRWGCEWWGEPISLAVFGNGASSFVRTSR